VEEQGQLARLRGMGCELGQGFYFARPAPLDQLIPRTNRFLAGDQAVSRMPGLDRADIATD
jgi:predicted signal transduction protein with EAL and GGDEF domain